jgi:hypothetical protein
MWRFGRDLQCFRRFPQAIAGQTENICEMACVEGNDAVGLREFVKDNEAGVSGI